MLLFRDGWVGGFLEEVAASRRLGAFPGQRALGPGGSGAEGNKHSRDVYFSVTE